MKKNIFTLVLCLTTLITNAQNQEDPKNELSLYFKDHISKNLLKSAKFKSKKETIEASFCVDKNLEIYNFKTTNYNKELNSALKTAFINYPIEKLPIDSIDQSKKYSFQIISKKKSKNIFNCSNIFNTTSAPVFKDSLTYSQYPDRIKQFNKEVKNQFVCNFDFNLIEKKQKTSFIRIKYKITKSGILKFSKTSKSHSKKYLNEMNRVFKLIQISSPPLFNNKPIQTTQNIYISLLKEDQHETICQINTFGDPLETSNYISPLDERTKKFLEYSQPTTSNNLTVFFKQNLTKGILLKTNLNDLNDNIKISFNLNEKNQYSNIKTTARSTTVSDELKRVLSMYPINKLNLTDQHPLNKYYLQILSFENNIPIVSVSTNILFERIPIITGCENSKTAEEGKTCFSTQVSKHINRKFNSGLAKTLGLSPGKKRIYCMFTVASNGDITNIKVKAPHPALQAETIRVVKTLPKLKHSASQNGKPVSIKYSLPIVFMVGSSESSYSSNNNYSRSNAHSF